MVIVGLYCLRSETTLCWFYFFRKLKLALCFKVKVFNCSPLLPRLLLNRINVSTKWTFFYYYNYLFGGGCEQRAKYAVCSRYLSRVYWNRTHLTYNKTNILKLEYEPFILYFWLSQSCLNDVKNASKLNMIFLLRGNVALSCIQTFKTAVVFPQMLFQEVQGAKPQTQASVSSESCWLQGRSWQEPRTKS